MTETLLHEIDSGATRREVAQTYALALRDLPSTNWARVNAAIVARWSVAALAWIKKEAWSGRCVR
jgi:hypothetical protein